MKKIHRSGQIDWFTRGQRCRDGAPEHINARGTTAWIHNGKYQRVGTYYIYPRPQGDLIVDIGDPFRRYRQASSARKALYSRPGHHFP
jgi:hypothetical protein